MTTRAAASSPGVFPKTANPRPPLPPKWNKFLANSDPSPIVKFQPITKDSSVVIIGRVKVSTPTKDGAVPGHAYILRRYDTGYISLTTMWRAAFPSFAANSQQEKDETNWVRSNFDLTNAPGEKMRLAGVWIPLDLARYLAPSYNLSPVVTALSESQPSSDAVGRAVVKPEEEPSSVSRTPNGPNKRRKEAHDTPSTNGTSHTTPTSAVKTPSRTKGKSPAPAARRSTPSRTVKSNKAPSPSPSTSSTRKSGRASRVSVAPTVAKTTEENENESDEELRPWPAAEEDLAESRNLVERLKAEQTMAATKSPRTTVKRAREEDDAPVLLNLEKTSQEIDMVPPSERAVVTNSRILPRWPTLPTLEPSQKAAAWGTLAFAIGWGATTLLPQFM